ncbi:MAG: hydantoinase/oxoprolinase family protein [Desulfobacterales bacterium]|nr:hydantoinase/oxoprolinase family protein [Desulfobacterales bacterium]
MLIGLDVGGTHTDVVLIGKEGLIKKTKVPTDPNNLFESILEGLEVVTESMDTHQVKRLVLSTTLATNAVVTGSLSSVAMVVAAGPGLDPRLYACCDAYHCIRGAVDHRGREVEGLDEEVVERLAAGFREQGIDTVGVVGKFSTRNPAHEQRMEAILRKAGIKRVFTGHSVSGNLNFPRRIHTTFLNASVSDVHCHFYESVRESLKCKGIDVPIYILKADGGTMGFEDSMERPGEAVMSGPSASVMGAVPWANAERDSLVLDVGGTTTDISVLVKRAPVLEPLGITIGPWRTLIRSLKSISVGIGGDSRIWVENGVIHIGPERRGLPMALGGEEPTPTDAMNLLSDEESRGDRSLSEKGMTRIGDALGLAPEEAAAKVMETLCCAIVERARRMVEEINAKPVYTIHELMDGYRVAPEEILLLGGPAERLAPFLAQYTDARVKIVPKAGVANAIGACLARPTREVTLFADTEKGVILVPEENYSKVMKSHFTLDDAHETARRFLLDRLGDSDLETEVVESMAFNMVRGFRTTGKNIRVRVQVKPGLVSGYRLKRGGAA